jgi:hypothetical protein
MCQRITFGLLPEIHPLTAFSRKAFPLQLMLQKAARSLAAARRLVKSGDYDIEMAETVVEAIAAYLTREGFIPSD